MTMLTAVQARAALDKAEREGGDNAWLVVKSLIADLYKRLDLLEAEHAKTRKGAIALAKENKAFGEIFQSIAQRRGVMSPVSEPEAVEGDNTGETVGAAASIAGEVRIGADGTPMSPEQAATEAEMDAAMGIAPGPTAPAALVRRNGNGNGNKRRVPAPPQTRVGADGKPLDAAQAEAEAMMDAAAGPRQ
ncbi:MAG: hypothetical protein UY96_C0003G0013 [Parcubacteria group bacterium GW2011_GWB1_56_8]|nr:MAG: hypothetical protein UY96_C0003G0013 [Parcubacteria group bacterium GW2011_GWB1_56_8]